MSQEEQEVAGSWARRRISSSDPGLVLPVTRTSTITGRIVRSMERHDRGGANGTCTNRSDRCLRALPFGEDLVETGDVIGFQSSPVVQPSIAH